MKNFNFKQILILLTFASLLLSVQLQAQKPNIIIIKTDDQRWSSLGVYGDPIVKTPQIDELAEEGMRFENAFTVAVLCTPSRTSFFSGKYASTNRAFDNSEESMIGGEEFSFIQTLKEAGYKIGLSGKNHTFTKEYAEKWFDFFEEYSPWGKHIGTLSEADKEIRKYRTTAGAPSRLGNLLLEGLIDYPEPFEEEICMTARIGDDAITFVEENRNHPFFLHMSFPAPHWPNFVCEPYFSMYMDQLDEISLAGMDEIDWDSHPFAHFVQSQATGFDNYTKEERRKILAIMYGQITFIDKSVGRLMEALRKQGIYDETLVVFTSDQGCFGGQFGLPSKTKGFYESLIRVPFILKLPGDHQRGRVTSAQISNIDVMPTLLEYAGIQVPEALDGKSFLSVLLDGKDVHRTEVYAEVGRPAMPPAPFSKEQFAAYNAYRSHTDGFWFIDYTTRGRCAMIREDGWKYCYYNGDMEELYYFEKDTLELENLAYHPAHQERKEAMREKLMQQNFYGIGSGAKELKW